MHLQRAVDDMDRDAMTAFFGLLDREDMARLEAVHVNPGALAVTEGWCFATEVRSEVRRRIVSGEPPS